MKKKLIAVLLTAAMAVTLISGCQSAEKAETTAAETTAAETEAAEQSDSAETAAASEAAETDAAETDAASEAAGSEAGGDTGAVDGSGKFVGVTVPSVGNDFMLALSDMMKAAIEETGAKVQLDSAENNVTTQIEQIENYASMGCDIMVVWAVNGEGVASACQKAQEQGIQVVAFAYEIPGAASSVISASEEAMAAQCVEMASTWIDENFPDAGDGEVKTLVVSGSSTPEAVIRSDGLKAIADNSKVNLINAEVSDQDKSEEARSLAENTFQTDADIDVILCMNGTIALGFESFLDSSSSPLEDKSKFAIFCVDEAEEIVSKIQASANNESVLRGTVSMGSLGDTVGDVMKALTPLLKGEEPIHVEGSAMPITAATLAE